MLIGESFSPWTKKARWALEYCRLDYRYQEYIPTLSELGVRIKLRQLTGQVSVPILMVGRDVYRGSWEIACFANQESKGRSLGDMEAISYWDQLSEDALAEGRTRVVRSVLSSKAALIEAMPSFIPDPLKPSLRFMARDAVQRLDKKYQHLLKPGSIHHALTLSRAALNKSESNYILGEFTYADIVMAVVLEVVDPIAAHQPPLGAVTQTLWQDRSLAEAFYDLIKWRDALAADKSTSYSQFLEG